MIYNYFKRRSSRGIQTNTHFVCLEAFAATKFNEVFSGREPVRVWSCCDVSGTKSIPIFKLLLFYTRRTALLLFCSLTVQRLYLRPVLRWNAAHYCRWTGLTLHWAWPVCLAGVWASWWANAMLGLLCSRPVYWSYWGGVGSPLPPSPSGLRMCLSYVACGFGRSELLDLCWRHVKLLPLFHIGLVPETSQQLHTLMRLSAREDFTKTDILFVVKNMFFPKIITSARKKFS